jgi:hypothetical protein
MGGDILASDAVLGNALLIATHQVKDLEGTLVDLRATIGDDAHYDLLPAIWSPHLRAGAAAKVGNVLDNCVHRPDEEDFVFVVHGQDDEKLRLAPVEIWSKGIPLAHKLIRITRSRSVAHFGELLALFRGRDNVRRHLDVEDEITILERDLTDGLERPETSAPLLWEPCTWAVIGLGGSGHLPGSGSGNKSPHSHAASLACLAQRCIR